MRTIIINNESFEVSDDVTNFAAGVEAVEAQAKAALPEKATAEQITEQKRALDAIKAHRAEVKSKTIPAKAEAATTITEGAK